MGLTGGKDNSELYHVVGMACISKEEVLHVGPPLHSSASRALIRASYSDWISERQANSSPRREDLQGARRGPCRRVPLWTEKVGLQEHHARYLHKVPTKYRTR